MVATQRAFFESGATLPLQFRLNALKRLEQAVGDLEADIYAALAADLGKNEGEAYMTEVGLVRKEIVYVRKHLSGWMRPRRVATPLYAQPGASRIYSEPFGVTLNISPWNYPFQLALIPLIDALGAGNCMLLKPSSKTPHTVAVLREIVERAFAPEHVHLVEGGAEAAEALLKERFDFIFYTGSKRVGKGVMRAAGAFLTPVCLELGGKSPAVVFADANLADAARKIAWGKLLNAGQTCIAPDYLLVHKSVKAELEALLEAEFARFPGVAAVHNPAYGRIINQAAMERLAELARSAGGEAQYDLQTMRMAPLLLTSAQPDDAVMQEEIFGPLLPSLGFERSEEARQLVLSRPRPLACYLFGKDRREIADWLARVPFGGGAVNDTMLHMSSPELPFGGVGGSGMGRYHGRFGFELFSNQKGVLVKSTWFDAAWRYLPIETRGLAWLRRFLG